MHSIPDTQSDSATLHYLQASDAAALQSFPDSGIPNIPSILGGLDYIDAELSQHNISYFSSQHSRINIPATGRAILVANNPLGSLNALALLRFVSEIRPDVKLVSLDTLQSCSSLRGLVIDTKGKSWAQRKAAVKAIFAALADEELLILFPGKVLSRGVPAKPKEGKWNHRFLRLALNTCAPLLPVHIKIQYAKRPLVRPSLWRAQRARNLHIHVGQIIPINALNKERKALHKQCHLLKRHLYSVAKGRPGFFQTQKAIVHPQHPARLREELQASTRLGETGDGQLVYLFDYQPDSLVMKEIGRLREYTFRYVGEGTGERVDLDRYDRYYRQLVLWSESNMEIVGAYRIGEPADILSRQGVEGLYCNALFRLNAALQNKLSKAVELGRSFVQPKYWGKRSLEYLWYGIGAYLASRPEVDYLYGPVSISNSYPKAAKDALVCFYDYYFGDQENLATARQPYIFEASDKNQFQFTDNYHNDFKRLKAYLAYLDVKVPTLYKQYSELGEPGGVRFLDFSVDPAFSYCVDGLVWVDINKMKVKKRTRYLGR